jgi:WD40 repeat protein/Flp pilus assembly protein TadD
MMSPSSDLQHWPAHEGRVYSLVFAPNSPHLVSAGEDGRLLLWSLDSTETHRALSLATNDVNFAGNDQLVVSQRGQSSGLSLFSTSSLELEKLLSIQGSAQWRLQFASAARQIFGLSEDRRSVTALSSSGESLGIVWKAREGEAADHLFVTPDARQFAVSISTASGHNALEIHGGGEGTRSSFPANLDHLQLTADLGYGAYVAENEIRIFESSTGRTIQSIKRARVNALAFAPHGEYLADVSDRTLTVWNWRDGSERWSEMAHESSAVSLAFSPDGRTIATVGDDGQIRFWRWQISRLALELPLVNWSINKIIFSPDGLRLLAFDADKRFEIYDATPAERAAPSAVPNIEQLRLAGSGHQQQSLEADRVRKHARTVERIHNLVLLATQKGTTTSVQKTTLLAALEKLAEGDPQQLVAHCRSIGDQLVTLNEPASAVVIYSEALEIAPHDAGLYLARGRAYFRQRGYAQAVRDLSVALEKRREDDKKLPREMLLVDRGIAYCRLERFDQGLADFEAAYEIAPLYALKLLAGAFNGSPSAPVYGLPKPELAPGIIKLVDRSETLTSDQPADDGRVRAMLLAQFGQYQRASDEYEILHADGEATWMDCFEAAVLAIAQQDDSGYKRWYAALKSKATPSSIVYCFWCYVLAPASTEDDSELIAAAQQMAANPPRQAAHRSAAGAVLVRAGQFDEGRKLLKMSIAANATGSKYWATRARSSLLAIAYHNEGRLEDAHTSLAGAKRTVSKFLESPRIWRDRLMMELLLREATELIEPQ